MSKYRGPLVDHSFPPPSSFPPPPIQNPARTTVERILVSGEHATVFVHTSGTSSSGHKLQDRAAWVVKIVSGKIVECDSFADTAAINE